MKPRKIRVGSVAQPASQQTLDAEVAALICLGLRNWPRERSRGPLLQLPVRRFQSCHHLIGRFS